MKQKSANGYRKVSLECDTYSPTTAGTSCFTLAPSACGPAPHMYASTTEGKVSAPKGVALRSLPPLQRPVPSVVPPDAQREGAQDPTNEVVMPLHDGSVSDESGDESYERQPAGEGEGKYRGKGRESGEQANLANGDTVDEEADNDGPGDQPCQPRRASFVSVALPSPFPSPAPPYGAPSLTIGPPPTMVHPFGPPMYYGSKRMPLKLLGPRFTDVPPWLADRSVASNDGLHSHHHHSHHHHHHHAQSDMSLHDEIIAFCKWVSPSAEEKQMREDVISRIWKVVMSHWPSVQLCVFGSCATDIYLPTSDIDLCIMGATACSSSPIHELASLLRRRCMGQVQAINTARVPIIKLVDGVTGCLVDISFDVPTGPAHINFIKKYLDEEPVVKPLALLLKYYLKQFGMNEPYTGGLGSYALLIMIISYLQLYRPVIKPEKQKDLGVLLLGFLNLYGRKFNYVRTGISVRDGGYYYAKLQRGWIDWNQPYLLSAEDPCFPENDVSRMSYAIMDVRECLDKAYKQLKPKKVPNTVPSMLCRILLQDEKMMEQRKFIRNHYRLGLPPPFSSPVANRSGPPNSSAEACPTPTSPTAACPTPTSPTAACSAPTSSTAVPTAPSPSTAVISTPPTASDEKSCEQALADTTEPTAPTPDVPAARSATIPSSPTMGKQQQQQRSKPPQPAAAWGWANLVKNSNNRVALASPVPLSPVVEHTPVADIKEVAKPASSSGQRGSARCGGSSSSGKGGMQKAHRSPSPGGDRKERRSTGAGGRQSSTKGRSGNE